MSESQKQKKSSSNISATEREITEKVMTLYENFSLMNEVVSNLKDSETSKQVARRMKDSFNIITEAMLDNRVQVETAIFRGLIREDDRGDTDRLIDPSKNELPLKGLKFLIQSEELFTRSKDIASDIRSLNSEMSRGTFRRISKYVEGIDLNSETLSTMAEYT